MILQLTSDTPDRLRPIEEDIVRILEEAHEQQCFYEFKEWLLKQDLQPRTRGLVERAQLLVTLP